MHQFTASIASSLESQNWLAALFMALALPDICAGLEAPGRGVGDRYKDWFQRYLRASYHPSSMYELLAVTAPDALARMPPQVADSLRSQPAPEAAAFTADDCYRLRCRCLHQGLSERMRDERIHFTAPDPTGRLVIHRNAIDGVLQLAIDAFCRDVAAATMRWWEDVQQNPEVLARSADLIKVYGYDAPELPLVATRASGSPSDA